ncbi:MAG: putative metal-dependent hydrolase, partial [Planctomycetota bacterium]
MPVTLPLMHTLPYLTGYSPEIIEHARSSLAAGTLGARVAERYPDRHEVHSNKALYTYVQELKARYMKTAPPLAKVLFDDQLTVLHNALGLHVTSSRVHGSRTRTLR